MADSQQHADQPSPVEAPAGPTFPSSNPAAPTVTGSAPPSIVEAEFVMGTLLGPYRLLEKLGEGGMGAVYKAVHQHLDKVVAIKVLPKQFTQQPDAVARFKREMKAVGKIDHPHIVRAMDAGEINGMHFLAMEFVAGLDLAQFVKEHGRLSVVNACKAVRQTALALQAAHAVGLIHRDIKPSNILVAKTGQIKLLDLGLALLAEEAGESTELTTAGRTFGTPDYMAPEQWENAHAADARTDLYALGCVLYFLLTGQAPYATERYRTTASKMKAHVLDPAPNLQDAVPHAPEGLAAVYQKLVAKSASDRFQTAAELVQALTPFVTKSAAVVSTVTTAAGSSSTAVAPSRTEIPPAPSATPAVSQSAAPAPAAATTMTLPGAPQPPRRRSRFWLRSGLAGFAALVLGVIIITITNKDGTQTKIEVPDTSKVEISTAPAKTGLPKRPDPSRQVPKQATAKVATPATETTGWHGWPADAPKPAIAPFNADQAKQSQETWAKYLNVPVEYTNSIGMKFRLIPPGEFMMGSTRAEVDSALKDVDPQNLTWRQCILSETPEHRVRLTLPFYLGVHEVTQGQYQQVTGINPSYYSPASGRTEFANLDTANHPVDSVRWDEAVKFCAALNKHEKLKVPDVAEDPTGNYPNVNGFRLPTEAEWEFAGRGGTVTKYWNGNEDKDLTKVAWIDGNSGDLTHPVGELAANPLGLYDVHGNVWEWVHDRWEANYYDQFQDSVTINPRGSFSGSGDRIQRGGARCDIPSNCRTSTRHFYAPWAPERHIGFRVGLAVDAVRQALKVTGPAMPQPAVTPPSPHPTDAIDYAAERQAAEAFLKLKKGIARTNLGDVSEPLPDAPFHLVSVTFQNAGVTDEDLAIFANCRGLNYIDLYYNPLVTSKGLQNFKHCRSLKKLHASYTAIDSGIVELLPNWPVFERLLLSNSRVSDKMLTHLRDCPTLLQLEVGGTPLTDVGIAEWVRHCPNLQEIGIQYLDADGDNHKTLVPLKSLRSLKRVSCSAFQVTEEGVAGLRELPDFEGFEIFSPTSDEAMARVAKFGTKLKSFRIFNWAEWDKGITDAGYQSLLECRALQKIVFEGRGGDAFSNEMLVALAELPDLRSLILRFADSSHQYTAEGVAKFRKLRPDVELFADGKDYPSDGWPLAVVKKLDETDPLPKWELPEGAPPPVVAPCDPAEATALQQKWADYLHRPVVVENKLGMKFALIPPGEFRKIFTRSGNPGIESDMPIRRFRITKPYAMSTTEVTWDQFRQFVEATGYKTEAETNGLGGRNHKWEYDPQINWRSPGWQPKPMEPIVQVTYRDALAFCAWLNTLEESASDGGKNLDNLTNAEDKTIHRTYRLPTEAEWQHATRAGSVLRHVVGTQPQSLDDYAWTRELSDPPFLNHQPHVVGLKKNNPFGLSDTLGNVWEYASSCLSPSLLPYWPTSDPYHANSFCILGQTRWEARENHHPDYTWEQCSQPQGTIGFRVLMQLDNEGLPGPFEYPLLVQPGQPISDRALVPRPTPIPGLRSWSVEMASHDFNCEAVAWSPDGQRIVTAGSHNGTICVWDRAGNRERVLLGAIGTPHRLAISPDGKYLASGERFNAKGVVRVWEMESGRLIAIFPTPGWPNSLEFAPDGSQLAFRTIWDNSLQLHSMKLGSFQQSALGSQSSNDLSWSADGQKLLSGGTVIDATTLSSLKKLEWKDQDKVVGAGPGKWSPNGQWIAANCEDGAIRLWDTATYSLSKVVQIPERSLSVVAWTKDGLLVAESRAQDGRRLVKWDVAQDKLAEESALLSPLVPDDYVYALSPDLNSIAFCQRGRPLVFDFKSGQVVAEGPVRGEFDNGVPSPSGQVVSKNYGTFVFDTVAGTPIGRVKPGLNYALVWSAQGDRYLQYRNTPLSVESPEIVNRNSGDAVPLLQVKTRIHSAAWSPDGSVVALGTEDGTLTLWDANTGKPKSEWNAYVKPSDFFQIAWSPDGRKLATLSAGDERILIWDAQTHGLLRAIPMLFGGPPDRFCQVVWLPNSLDFWFSFYTDIRRYNWTSGEFSPPENCSGGQGLNSLSLSPDGRQLLVRSSLPVKLRTNESNSFLGYFIHGWTMWMPDNRRALIGGTGYDVAERRRLGTFYPWVTGDHWLCIGPTGHVRGGKLTEIQIPYVPTPLPASLEEQIVYVALHEDGSQVTYSPREFAEKFGWKNDPEQATLLGK